MKWVLDSNGVWAIREYSGQYVAGVHLARDEYGELRWYINLPGIGPSGFIDGVISEDEAKRLALAACEEALRESSEISSSRLQLFLMSGME